MSTPEWGVDRVREGMPEEEMELKTPVGAACHDAQDQPGPWVRSSQDSHSQVRGHNMSGPSEAH